MSDLRKEMLDLMIKKCATDTDNIISAGLPRDYDISKITRVRIVGTLFETWSYEGKPFLELHDPEPNSSWDGGDAPQVGFTINYRYWNPDPESEAGGR